MAHKFTKPLERLSDPRSLEDVSRLIAGDEEGHKVTNQFYYNGVLILEVVSKRDPQFTRNDKNESERESKTRRILILGHTVNSDDMVALQLKHQRNPWISHGLRFGSEKRDKKEIHHPGVAWCKGLAMVHTGSSFAHEKTNSHRMKQVTELMQLVCGKSVAWRELDLDALKAKIDSFEQYLDPELCSQKLTQSPDSESPTNTTSPKSGRSMPRESLAVKPTTSPEDERYPAITDDLGETEENAPPDLSTASTADKTDSQTSHMGRRRTHDIAFNTDSERMSPATTKSSVSKRRLQEPDQLRKQIMTDMEILVEVYQDFARVSVESMDVPVGSRGLKVLDMANLEKPTSYPECVQQLMNALNANALHECFDDAFEALDYDVADTLCDASRALLNHYRQVDHAHNDDLSPKGAQKCACEKFMDEAKRYLQILEQMTKGDAIAKVIDVEWRGDSNARLEQLIQLATVDGEVHITVDVVMQYMQAARIRRANDTLHEFLVKVKRMTKALGSAIEHLKELQS